MIKWELCNSRRLAVQGALAWNKGIGKYFKERYGTGIFNTNTYFDGNRTDYFFDQNQHKLFNGLIDTSFANREFVLSMIPESKETLEEKYEHIKVFLEHHENLSGEVLADKFKVLSILHGDFYPRKWMAYRICHRIDLQVEKKLEKLGKSKEEITEFLRVLSIPLKPNYVILEKMDLLKIAIEKNNISNKELNKKLEEHTAKYRHMPLFDFDHNPYTKEYCTKKLEFIENPKEELRLIHESFIKRNEEFDKLIKQINFDNDLRNLLVMLKRAIFFRDYADTIRQKMNFHLRNFYIYIGLKIGLNLDEIVLLTDEEIYNHIKNGIKFSSNELARRKKAFLLTQIGDRIFILSGDEAKKEVERLNLYSKLKKVNILHGLVAFPGNIEGKSKVIYTNKDLYKIEEGDIIVTTMTRQDFVPYFGKIRALITEEGGITCHAAIIARELGIPCIVGVDNATKLIEDNNVVRLSGTKIEILNDSLNP
jgi:phosphohistidine swiveling domain-containing protein